VEFVDEAHRLFSNESRYKDLLAESFNRAMVEGRSLNHGVIISLQNASQVPPLVLNNINTHIVMRQNNREVARAATQTMDKEFADWSITLASGEALIKMFESRATVFARMAPSPYELERTDNVEQ
jgi:DNA helicase HerA-like ATPase